MNALLISIVLAISGFDSFAHPQQSFLHFTLTGQLGGRDTGKIILWYPDSSGEYIKDTARLEKGKFSFSGTLRHPSYAHLIGSERDGNYASFFLEGGAQTISLKENQFDEVEMSGSESQVQNEMLYSAMKPFEKRIDSLLRRKRLEQKAKKGIGINSSAQDQTRIIDSSIQNLESQIYILRYNFIKQHPDSYVSATELLNIIGSLTIQQADFLLSSLTPPVRESKAGKLSLAEIEKKRSLKKGNTFPFFTAIDLQNARVGMAKFKGKYVLVDFWASWCIPCRKAIPYVKGVYKKYHSKGFDVLGISIDKDSEQWKKAVLQDKTENWIHIRQDNHMESLFKAIQVVPTQILLDTNSVIIWSSLEENAQSWADLLKEKLEK